MKILLIAPLDTGTDKFRSEARDFRSSKFVDRDTDQANYGHLSDLEGFTPRYFEDDESDFRIYVSKGQLYKGLGWPSLVLESCVENLPISSRLTRNQIVAIERLTTRVSQQIADELLKHKHVVKWANRTLVATDEEAELYPEWTQKNHGSDIEITRGDFHVSFHWGNNHAHCANFEDLPTEVAHGICVAQALWCEMDRLDYNSSQFFQEIKSRISRNNVDLLNQVIDHHLRLAQIAIVRDRLIGARPILQTSTEECLTAWNFDQAIDKIESRISRLEHIIEARTEIIARKNSIALESILFALALTGLISLLLTFLQTALIGEGVQPPSGATFEFFRNYNSDFLIIGVLTICILLTFVAYKEHVGRIFRWQIKTKRRNRDD